MHCYKNLSNVGQIFKDSARMEGEMEETPPNTERQWGNVASQSSDGPETSGRHSLSTTAPISTPECAEKPIMSSERANLSGEYFNLHNNK